jgi:hypothetical protein
VGVACVVGQLAASANASGAPDQAACPAPGTVRRAVRQLPVQPGYQLHGRALYWPDEHAASWVIAFTWCRPVDSPVPMPTSLRNAAELVGGDLVPCGGHGVVGGAVRGAAGPAQESFGRFARPAFLGQSLSLTIETDVA